MLYKIHDHTSFQFHTVSSYSAVSRSAIGEPKAVSCVCVRVCVCVYVLSNPVPSVGNMSRGSHAEMGDHKDTQERLSHEPMFPFSGGQIR